jgi:hypothetical protein
VFGVFPFPGDGRLVWVETRPEEGGYAKHSASPFDLLRPLPNFITIQ